MVDHQNSNNLRASATIGYLKTSLKSGRRRRRETTLRSLLTIMPNEGGGCEQMQWFYDLDSEVLLVNLKESEFLKESESEHGDKTYLVRTDLAGQVKPQRSFNF